MKSIHTIPTIQMDINTGTQLQKQTCSVVFENTKLQCVKCLKSEDEIADCDLCNGHTETANASDTANANANANAN